MVKNGEALFHQGRGKAAKGAIFRGDGLAILVWFE